MIPRYIPSVPAVSAAEAKSSSESIAAAIPSRPIPGVEIEAIAPAGSYEYLGFFNKIH
jgi:hypothetical protein